MSNFTAVVFFISSNWFCLVSGCSFIVKKKGLCVKRNVNHSKTESGGEYFVTRKKSIRAMSRVRLSNGVFTVFYYSFRHSVHVQRLKSTIRCSTTVFSVVTICSMEMAEHFFLPRLSLTWLSF